MLHVVEREGERERDSSERTVRKSSLWVDCLWIFYCACLYTLLPSSSRISVLHFRCCPDYTIVLCLFIVVQIARGCAVCVIAPQIFVVTVLCVRCCCCYCWSFGSVSRIEPFDILSKLLNKELLICFVQVIDIFTR